MSASTSSRRPVPAIGGAVATCLAFMGVTIGGGAVVGALFPSASGQTRALVMIAILTVIVLGLAPRVAPRVELGVNGPSCWRRPHLFVLPSLLALSPLVLGVRPVAAGTVAVLAAGYLLTGVTEELLWRGIVLRQLRVLGTTGAVLVGAALFGVAHLSNLFFRDSGALVLAQAWGAFCFGVGYGALRLRTGTIVPLMLLHAVSDFAAAVGAVPKIPVLVGQDVVLLDLGLVLLLPRPRAAVLSSPGHRLSETF